MIKKLLCIALLSLALAAQAEAASYPVIVEVSASTNISLVAAALKGTVVDAIPGTRVYLLAVSEIPVLSSVQLSLLGITSLELDKIVGIPRYAQLGVLSAPPEAAHWYLRQPSMERIQAAGALQYATGRGVVIADINSKVDYAHPALRGHLTGGYDFVSSRSGYAGVLNQSSAAFLDESSAAFLDESSAAFLDESSAAFLDQSAAAFLDESAAAFLDGNPAANHGTLCAGILAVMAPESQIMPLRVFDDNGNTDIFSIARALHWARQNEAHVINMSFGMTTNSATIQKAVASARQAGMAVVASAGNNNTTAAQYPAAYSGVITVAATDPLDKKAGFSNYGSKIYVTAPGVNIISAVAGGFYGVVSGTSFSAPMVAAEAALIRSVKPDAVYSNVASGIVNINAQNPAYVGKLGYGRINVVSAVRR
ncbi:MAG: S8 family serine peptidase [Acidobacteria bacterium]|nr:S8 family serine peptidase [Acidobacteriota bacterium]